MLTLSGSVNGAAQIFATADASTNLAELAVYVTSDSGVTPVVTDPVGRATRFATAEQLAGFLLGHAVQAGTATPVLLSAYALTVSWLEQVDQPLLQTAEQELIAARAAEAAGNAGLAQADEVTAQVQLDTAASPAAQRGSASLASAAAYAQAAATAVAAANPTWAAFDETGARVNLAAATGPSDKLITAAQKFVAQGQTGIAAGNVNLVTLCGAGADLCLQELAEPAGARILGVERIYQSGNVTLDVAVDPNAADPYGSATFHSKDQDGGITGFLEPLLTAVLDLAAVVTGNEWALAVAAVVNAGESAQNFAEGNVLAGVLDLGSAAGFGAEAVSAFAAGADGLSAASNAGAITKAAGTPTLIGTVGSTAKLGSEILNATALVGGLSGIVNSAENGDGLGVVSATLETAAAVASGLVTAGNTSDDVKLISIVSGIAGGAAAGVDAIEHGHVADGLLTTLGPLFASIYANAQSNESGSQQLAAVLPFGSTASDIPLINVYVTPSLPYYAVLTQAQSVLYINGITHSYASDHSVTYYLAEYANDRPPASSGDPYIDDVDKVLNEVLLDVLNSEPAGSGPVYGTTIHTIFKAIIDRLVNDGFLPAGTRTEISFTNGQEQEYGVKGTSRADVLLTDPITGAPVAVFDVKTGSADLSTTRRQTLSSQFGVPIDRVYSLKWIPVGG